jgi:hypothetical protein
MSLRRLIPALAPLVLLCPTFASAQEPQQGTESAEDKKVAAQRAFSEGQRAYGAGDYRHAADSFELAYKLKPHPDALWNAARSRQRAGDVAKAANLFAKFLKEAPPNSRDRNTAQTALRQLGPKLGQLEIHAVGLEDVKVDREPVDTTTVYVNPGAHVVEAHVGDRPVQQAQTVEAGEVQSVALVAPSEPPPPTPTEGQLPIVVTTGTPDADKVKPHHGWSPVVVVVGSVLTAAGAITTIISGLDTTSQKTKFDNNPTQSNLDSGKSKETRTNVALGVTVGLGVLTGAAAIWLVDWKGKDRGVQVGVSGTTMQLGGSF